MHLKRVDIRIHERRRRPVEIGITIAAFGQPPRLAAIIGTQDAAHFNRRISAAAVKRKAAHAARFRRIRQHPAMPIAQLRYFFAFAPRLRAIARNKQARRFSSREFAIRNIGMVGKPADVSMFQSSACRAPRLSNIVGSKHTVSCSGEDDTFACDEARHMLIG